MDSLPVKRLYEAANYATRTARAMRNLIQPNPEEDTREGWQNRLGVYRMYLNQCVESSIGKDETATGNTPQAERCSTEIVINARRNTIAHAFAVGHAIDDLVMRRGDADYNTRQIAYHMRRVNVWMDIGEIPEAKYDNLTPRDRSGYPNQVTRSPESSWSELCGL